MGFLFVIVVVLVLLFLYANSGKSVAPSVNEVRTVQALRGHTTEAQALTSSTEGDASSTGAGSSGMDTGSASDGNALPRLGEMKDATSAHSAQYQNALQNAN